MEVNEVKFGPCIRKKPSLIYPSFNAYYMYIYDDDDAFTSTAVYLACIHLV